MVRLHVTQDTGSVCPHRRRQPSCEVPHLTGTSEGDPTVLFVTRVSETITWPCSVGPPCGGSPGLLLHCHLLSVLFSCLVNLFDTFFSRMEAMVRCSWKRVLGSRNLQSWPCDRLLRTAAHLGNISLNFLCFLGLAQMLYVWEKWTGHAGRQWEIFGK